MSPPSTCVGIRAASCTQTGVSSWGLCLNSRCGPDADAGVLLCSQALFAAIRSSIFNTIIEQAPFAIEDLMKELKAAADSDSDSGQASGEEPGQTDKGEQKRGGATKKPQQNGASAPKT